LLKFYAKISKTSETQYIIYYFACCRNPNGNVDAVNETWERFDPMTHSYLEINKADNTKYNSKNSWINASLELFPISEDSNVKLTPTPISSSNPIQSDSSARADIYGYVFADCDNSTDATTEYSSTTPVSDVSTKGGATSNNVMSNLIVSVFMVYLCVAKFIQ